MRWGATEKTEKMCQEPAGMSMPKFDMNCAFEGLDLSSHKSWNTPETDSISKQHRNAIQESLFAPEPSDFCPQKCKTGLDLQLLWGLMSHWSQWWQHDKLHPFPVDDQSEVN